MSSCCPSRSEGFGIALAEAMGCGTPVISTDGYGPSEIVDRGRYGVLVPPQNPTALATALGAAGEMRRRFPPESLKARAAEFSDAACASGYLSLFHRLTIDGPVRVAPIDEAVGEATHQPEAKVTYPSSSAPAFEVMFPPSKPAEHRSTASNSSSSAYTRLHRCAPWIVEISAAAQQFSQVRSPDALSA